MMDTEVKCSYFASYKENVPASEMTLREFVDEVRTNPDWRERVANIATLKAAGDEAGAKALKQTLPALTISANLKTRDKEIPLPDRINYHTGYLQIDLDGKDNPADLLAQRGKLEKDPHTQAAFTSPSGNGLKLIVRIPADFGKHRAAFATAQCYYLEKYGLTVDNSTSDPVRLCFVSADVNAFLREDDAEMFVPDEKLLDAQNEAKPAQKRVPVNAPMTLSTNASDREKDARAALEAIRRGNPRPDYELWLKIANALFDEFGTAGASMMKEYFPEEHAGEYDEKMKHSLERVKLETLFHIAKSYGFDPAAQARTHGWRGQVIFGGNAAVQNSVPVSCSEKPNSCVDGDAGDAVAGVPAVPVKPLSEFSLANFDAEIEIINASRLKPILRTPFASLNKALGGGFTPGRMYGLAGIPGAGKSSLAAQLALWHAVKNNKPVIFLSLEMSERQVLNRFISAISAQSVISDNAGLQAHENAKIGNYRAPWKKPLFAHSARKFQKMMQNENFFLITPVKADGISLSKIAQLLKSSGKADLTGTLLIVDYLQFMTMGAGGEERGAIDQQIAGLKQLTISYNLSTICLSAINRASYGVALEMNALKGSGGLEFTFDSILVLDYAGTREIALKPESEKKKWKEARERAKAEAKKSGGFICYDLEDLKPRDTAGGKTQLAFRPRYNYFCEVPAGMGKREDAEFNADEARELRRLSPMDISRDYTDFTANHNEEPEEPFVPDDPQIEEANRKADEEFDKYLLENPDAAARYSATLEKEASEKMEEQAQ